MDVILIPLGSNLPHPSATAPKDNVVAMVKVERFINGHMCGYGMPVYVDDVLRSCASITELIEKAARDAYQMLDRVALMTGSRPMEAFDL